MRMARRSRFRVAGLGNRIIAYIIDYIIITVCYEICAAFRARWAEGWRGLQLSEKPEHVRKTGLYGVVRI